MRRLYAVFIPIKKYIIFKPRNLFEQNKENVSFRVNADKH